MGTKIEMVIDLYPDYKFMVAEGYDNAIIGVEEHTMRLVYSIPKCIKILMERDKMTYDEAIDYVYTNNVLAYVGEGMPIWMNDEIDL